MDKKKIIIAAAIAAVVAFLALVVVGGIGGIYYLGVVKPFNDTKAAINAGDVDTVVDLYDSLKRDGDREYVKNEMMKYFENSVGADVVICIIRRSFSFIVINLKSVNVYLQEPHILKVWTNHILYFVNVASKINPIRKVAQRSWY